MLSTPEEIGILRAWIDQGAGVPHRRSPSAAPSSRPIRSLPFVTAVRTQPRSAVETLVAASRWPGEAGDAAGSTLLHHAAGFGTARHRDASDRRGQPTSTPPIADARRRCTGPFTTKPRFACCSPAARTSTPRNVEGGRRCTSPRRWAAVSSTLQAAAGAAAPTPTIALPTGRRR